MVNKRIAISSTLAALLVISLYITYSLFWMPSTYSRNVIDLQYSQITTYSYTAIVKPSLLYDNKTEISTDRPLFTKLVEKLIITFEYSLTQTQSAISLSDTTLKYEATATLIAPDWDKMYQLVPETTKPTNFTNDFVLIIKDIEGLVKTIAEETGSSVYTYTYQIQPHIILEALADGRAITQDFTPTLKIKFDRGRITVDGLRNTKTQAITHTETEKSTCNFLAWTLPGPETRTASMITSISLSALLAISLWCTVKERKSRPFMERLNRSIRDRTIEASEPSKRIEKATIKVHSIEDLVKISEDTFKPIIHHDETFYILDSDIRFEFQWKAEKEIEEK